MIGRSRATRYAIGVAAVLAAALPGTAGAATFTNSAPINWTAVGANNGSLYPSPVVVAGMVGTITDVTVTINNLSHTFPDDLGFVLVAPNGDALLLQDGAGDDPDMVNVTYTLADSGATDLPNVTAWAPGAYDPTSHYLPGTSFPAPGPLAAHLHPGPAGGGTASFASAYAGDNANGTWNLFTRDFTNVDAGGIAGGWTLAVTTTGGADVTAPDTTITGGPAEGSTTTDATPAFTFTSDEPGTFECNVDAGAFAPCTSGAELPALTNGSHTFRVRAIDVALNPDASPASRTFTVAPAAGTPPDTTPPETTITKSPKKKSAKKKATIEFTSEAGAKFECSLNGAPFTPCTSPAAVKGKKGKNTFSVRAKDAAGNTDATPATASWKVKKKRKK